MSDTPTDRKSSSLFGLLAVVLPFYVFDQATKWWIVQNFFPYEERIISPGFFSLVNWQNTGAAFSIGTGKNAFFIAISAAALIGILIAYRRNAFADKWSRWAVVLLLSGILGNLTDRIVHGHVVDFLLFDLNVRFAHPWPAFNIADSCIFIAVALFIIGSFAGEKLAAEKQA
jgi:signal peptidase II